MNLKNIFDMTLLKAYMDSTKSLRLDKDLPNQNEKFIVIIGNKVVLPGVYSSSGIKNLLDSKVFEKDKIQAYAIASKPTYGGGVENYIEEGDLTPESKIFLEEFWKKPIPKVVEKPKKSSKKKNDGEEFA